MSSIPLNIVACEGDVFAALYREFRPRVVGLCRYFLGSREEAEDAASDVFLRLPKAMESYDRRLPFARWLSTVTGHYCLDLLRRWQTERRYFTHAAPGRPHPSSASSPLDQLLAVEQENAVRGAVSRLPEIYRRPLVLRYYNEMSYEQISERLGLNKGTVKTRIFRAKKELQRTLLLS